MRLVISDTGPINYLVSIEHVGILPVLFQKAIVPTAVRTFREAFPLVSLTMDECLRTELLERMHSEQMDVAFIRAPLTKIEGLTIQPLCSEPMVVALPT